MKEYQKQHSGLFLIELMVSILFFALAAALCLQLFAKASLKSTQSTELTHAVLAATSAAEAVEQGCSDAATLQTLLTDGEILDVNGTESLILTYDKDWHAADSQSAYTYVMLITFVASTNSNSLLSTSAKIEVTSADQPETAIYTISVDVPGRSAV